MWEANKCSSLECHELGCGTLEVKAKVVCMRNSYTKSISVTLLSCLIFVKPLTFNYSLNYRASTLELGQGSNSASVKRVVIAA